MACFSNHVGTQRYLADYILSGECWQRVFGSEGVR